MRKNLLMKIVSLPNNFIPFLLCFLVGPSLQAQKRIFQGRPLFADTSTIKVEIFLPIDSIVADNCHNPRYFKSRIVVEGSNGGKSLKAEVRKRAKFRCDPANCSLPPLMIKLNPKDAHGTIFQGCKKLKITHTCRPDKKGFQNLVYKEYLIYRMYNHITDTSFSVRPAMITYRISSTGKTLYQLFGFFIEDDDDVARRANAKLINAIEISDQQFEPRALALMSIFQYMIGNTDYNTQSAHNIKVLATGTHGPLIPLPYDFDWSGFVNAPYAQPALRTGLTQVTQRLYQGPCPADSILAWVTQRLLSKREAIRTEIEAFNRLSMQEKRQIQYYLQKFFRELDKPSRFKKRLQKTCKKSPGNAK